MASRRIFTKGQWAAAVGVALLLHVLLAWSLIAYESAFQPSPVGDGGGLAVESLSLNAGDLPLLTDIAPGENAPAVVDPAAPAEKVLHPVAPLEVRPMTEIVLGEPKQKKAPPKTPKHKPKEVQHHQVHKAPQTRGNNAATKSDGSPKRGRPGTAIGPEGVRSTGKTTGVDRAAAPQAGNPRPRYPLVARRHGHEGRVLIRVSVLGSGRVGSATVSGSSGHGALDQAALKAVKRWRFKPALRAGKPVTATVTVPVVFRLEG